MSFLKRPATGAPNGPRGDTPSRLKDTALGLGGANPAGFFAAQPDPPPKPAGFAFAFEQLEVGGYALLARVAARAGDEDTVALAEELAREERTAAAAVGGLGRGAGDARRPRHRADGRRPGVGRPALDRTLRSHSVRPVTNHCPFAP